MIMQSRNKPIHVLGLLGGAICLMVIVTILISTVMFMRNKKSNRILPNRRIRRRRTQTQPWLNSPFKRQQDPDKFKVDEAEDSPPNPEAAAENANYNNNVSNVVRIWPPPPPPCAPSLPPPPPMNFPRDKQWTVPTVSANVPPKAKPRKKPAITRQDTVNRALVSELKLRLEQKRLHHQ